MFVLGLTGSIGMGKTATAKMFAEEGVPVQDADAVVHALYEGNATPLIEAAFPGTTANGRVDRVKLGAQVFGNRDAIAALEKIVHPLVTEERERFIANAGKSGEKIVVLDIPLLYETGIDKRCNAVAVVSAPAEMQRARVLARPGMTADRFAAIMAKQMPDVEKRARADFIVDTAHGFDSARAQIREILRKVRKMVANAG